MDGIAILGLAVVVIIGIVVAVNVILLRRDLRGKENKAPWEPPLQAQIERTQMMGESLRDLSECMKDQASRERDKDLAVYAAARRKSQPINNPVVGSTQGDERVHQTNPRAEKILIPEGLSEEERAVLKDFFNL